MHLKHKLQSTQAYCFKNLTFLRIDTSKFSLDDIQLILCLYMQSQITIPIFIYIWQKSQEQLQYEKIIIGSTQVTGATALAGPGKCNAVDLTQILDQQKTSFICTIENILFLIKYALSLRLTIHKMSNRHFNSDYFISINS